MPIANVCEDVSVSVISKFDIVSALAQSTQCYLEIDGIGDAAALTGNWPSRLRGTVWHAARTAQLIQMTHANAPRSLHSLLTNGPTAVHGGITDIFSVVALLWLATVAFCRANGKYILNDRILIICSVCIFFRYWIDNVTSTRLEFWLDYWKSLI